MSHLNRSRSLIAFSFLCLHVLDCSCTPLKPPLEERWCFVKTGCNQYGQTSAWNQGTCKNGKTQSPINLPSDYELISAESEIDFSKARNNYDFTHFQLMNDGKHLELYGFKTVTEKKPSFTWFERNDSIYTLQEIHMHWGPSHDNGSEHSIGRKRYAMEMHLIHYRSANGNDGGYRDYAEALKSGYPDALATIAIMFQADIDGSASTSLWPLIKNMGKVVHQGDKARVDEGILKLSDILKVQQKAVAYLGSLTSPPCDEIVAWLVIPEPVNIKEEHVRIFRESVYGVDGKILTTNRRRRQPVNKRTIGIVNFKQ